MKNTNTTQSTVHVGQILKNYIVAHRIVKSALARRIGKNDNQILRYQKSISVSTDVLLAISHALKHNFFADIAALFPPEYSSSEAVDNSKDLRIAELEQKILILEAEKAVLVSVMKN